MQAIRIILLAILLRPACLLTAAILFPAAMTIYWLRLRTTVSLCGYPLFTLSEKVPAGALALGFHPQGSFCARSSGFDLLVKLLLNFYFLSISPALYKNKGFKNRFFFLNFNSNFIQVFNFKLMSKAKESKNNVCDPVPMNPCKSSREFLRRRCRVRKPQNKSERLQ